MINQNRYIRIISGVGGGQQVAERTLAMRIITQNPQLSPGVVVEADNINAVESVFGQGSEEYRRAASYFGFVSKSITSPRMISFYRWLNSAVAPTVIGAVGVANIELLKTLSAAKINLKVDDAAPLEVTADLTTATTLTDVADLLQTAINTAATTPPIPQLQTCSVTYNTNTDQFTLTGGVTGQGLITPVESGDPEDLVPLIGFGSGSSSSEGMAAQTPAEAVSASVKVSNNLGSIVIATPSVPMTIDEHKAIAEWNKAQNNMYLYSLQLEAKDLSAMFAALGGIGGTCLNLRSSASNDFIDQAPCEIMAATDYDLPNATQNYMFYQFPARNITVKDDSTADIADASRTNYIGATQVNGQTLAFYQRGILCGGSTDAIDINIYANEIWLKSKLASLLMSALLSMPRVPANESGKNILLSVIQNGIDAAKTNGTISAGKDINIVQQQYITQVSGSDTAWRQVASIGYWVSIQFLSRVNPQTEQVEWYAKYQLIYAKDDVIRAVEGNDILI